VMLTVRFTAAASRHFQQEETSMLMKRVAATVGAAAITGAIAASAFGSIGMNSTASTRAAAGRPVATDDLLCGLWQQGSDRISGQSDIDHPSGASSMGQQYDYTGQNCENEYNGIGGFSNGSGMYTWTVSHSNVNTVTDRGTEHVAFTLSADGGRAAGANGRITNYGFGTPISPPDPTPCGDRDIYYVTGHAYDPACSPSTVGNFNTHGGAQTGEHFRGMYGVVVYQDENDLQSPCQAGSQNYCFEGILKGQTN